MGGSLDVCFSSLSRRLTLPDPDCWGERLYELLHRRLSFAFVVVPSPLLRWVFSRDAWIVLWNSLRPLSVRFFFRGASVDDILLPPGDTQFCGMSFSASDVRLACVAQVTFGPRRLLWRFLALPADPYAARLAVV